MPRGVAYTIDSPPWNAMVTPALAQELQAALERFAQDSRYSGVSPVEIHFEPGIVGHHQVGRAADIYQVARRRLDLWRQDWDEAKDATEAGSALARQRKVNLGWRLYKALQSYGHWAQPEGYPVQLFGPWTREEGPHRAISTALLWAHRDHIHVAK